MNIKELLELGTKQTIFGNETRTNTFGTWGGDNKAFIKASPEIAAKLREIVDILPEIKQIMIWAMDTPAEKDTIAMMEKIEKCENN